MTDALPEVVTVNLADLQELIARSERRWLTVSSGAVYADLSEESIRRLLSAGRLTSHRPVKGRVLISRDELDAHIRGSVSVPRVGRGRKRKDSE